MEEHGSADPAEGEAHDHSRQPPAPGTYVTPYPPDPEVEPGPRSRPVTAALVAAALVVAVGAGSTLHTALNHDTPHPAPSVPASP